VIVSKPAPGQVAQKGNERKNIKKLSSNAPHSIKGSGSLPPVKTIDNPEVEQLQVYVDDDDLECQAVEVVENKSEF